MQTWRNKVHQTETIEKEAIEKATNIYKVHTNEKELSPICNSQNRLE